MTFDLPTAAYGFGPSVTVSYRKRPPTVRRIIETVAEYYETPVEAFYSARRGQPLARHRQVAMYLSKCLTPRSLPDIGRVLNRDHTTILHGVRQIEAALNNDGELFEDVEVLRGMLA